MGGLCASTGKTPAQGVSHGTRVLRGTALLIAGSALTMAVSFLLTPVMLHYLGNARFAVWAVVGGIVAYFVLLDLGLSSSLSRYVAAYEEVGDRAAIRQIITMGLAFYPILGAVLAPLLWWVSDPLVSSLDLAPRLADEATEVLWWSYLLVFATMALSTFRGVLMGVHRSDLAVAGDVAGQVVYAVSLIVLLRQGHGLAAVVIANYLRLVGFVVVALPAVLALVGRPVTARFRKDVLVSLASFSGWMQANNVAAAVNTQTDRIVIGTFVGITWVTPYELANRLALLVRTLPLQLIGPLIPAATSMHARRDDAALHRTYVDGTRVLGLLSLGLGGFLIAAAEPLLLVWLGRPVDHAALMLVLLVVAYALNNLTGVATSIIRAVGEPKYETYYTVSQALLNIALTVAFTVWWGVWGVIAGTVVSTIACSAMFMVIFHSQRQAPWRPLLDPLLRLNVSVGVAAAGVYVVRAVLPDDAFSSRLSGGALLLGLAALYTLLLAGAGLAAGFLHRAELARATALLAGRRGT